MLNQLRKQSGFTIIELLIVIAIIGILATLVLTNFQGAQAKGRDTVRKNDINSLYQKLEEYYNENGTYPNTAITATNAATLFPGIDLEAVQYEDDAGATQVVTTSFTDGTTAPTLNTTNNEEYILGLYGTGCASGGTCTKYVLETFLERETPAEYSKTSLN